MERSNAFGMLGMIINGFAPYLDDEDDTGLKYYVKSLELNSNNVGTLLNIVHSYGTDPMMHQNRMLFDQAYGAIVE